MKNIFTKLFFSFLLIFFLIESPPLIAQNVIWSEDFAGGQVPNNWTNIDASGQVTSPWVWEITGVTFLGQPDFDSPTATNGFAMFDSYSLGGLPSNHDVRLTTDAIDCSNLSTVIAKFSNQYSYFSNDGSSITRLGVSTDGTTFTYFTILTDVLRNDFTHDEIIEEVDISTIAAGQTTVYLQFRWVGNYEYTWRIDDVLIQDMFTPLKSNNLELEEFSLPNAYATPKTQLDTLFLWGEVENIGLYTQTNVQLQATIIDANSQIIFTDSIRIDSISPSSMDTMMVFNNYFLMNNLNTGNYTLTYNVTQDSIDDDDSDNFFDFDFVISDTVFSIDNGNFIGQIAGGSGNFNAGAYGAANYYYVPNDSSIATSVTFAVNNPFDVIGETVDLILYRVDVDNDGNLDDTGDGTFDSNDLVNNTVGFAEYTFTGFEASDELITVSLENFNNIGDEIVLDGEGSYLVYFDYAGIELMLLTVGEKIPYRNLNSIGVRTNTDFWALGGWPNGVLAVLRLNIGDIGTASQPVLAAHSIKVFPNPVKDYLNLTIDLEQQSKEVKLTLTNGNGQVLLTDYFQNIQQKNFQYNIENLPTGIYFLNIVTENGQLTKEIIIH